MKNKLENLFLHGLAFARQIIKTIQQNRRLKFLINLAMAIVLVVFIGSYVILQWSELKNIRVEFDLLKAWYALLLFGINMGFFIAAWHVIIQMFQSKNSFLHDAQIYSLTQIARLLPTPAWYLAGRVYYYANDGMQKRSALIATLSESVFHAWVGFVIYCLLTVTPAQPLTWLLLTVALIVSIFLVFRVLIYLKNHPTGFTNFQIYFRIGSVIVFFILTWLTSFPYFDLIIKSIAGQAVIPWIDLWKIWILSSIFAYIGSYTLGGVGFVREFSLVILLSPYLPPPLCLAVSVLSRLVMVVGNLAWSGVILLLLKIIFHFAPSWQNQNQEEIVQ